MEKSAFLLLFVFLYGVSAQSGKCGKRYLAGTKVVSGQTARPHSWPWQVSLNKGYHFCGGSLVSDQWVVTAAHCVSNGQTSGITVRLGEHHFDRTEAYTVERSVERIIVHPRYSSLNNDVALIKLSRKVTLKPQIHPVCLPNQGVSVDEVSGKECYITGWGRLAHNRPGARVLQEARLPVISKSKCRKHMGGVTDQMVCAGFGGSSTVSGCMGDSGGPFVCRDRSNDRWYLHGAVSWGSRTCSSEYNKFTVFARIAEFSDWIKRYVGNTVQPPQPTTSGSINPSSADCDFDRRNICSFRNLDATFKWSLQRSGTPSKGTGPQQDLSGRGYYIYIEASSPRKAGDYAKIATSKLSGAQCLTFHYNMNGDGMGELNVLVRNQAIFKKNGNQGSAWMKVEIPIPAYSEYEVVFKGVVGKNFLSDLAIDGISFKPGNCGSQPPRPTTSPPRPTRPTQPTEPSQSVNCNFDRNNKCNLKDLPADFQWTVYQGSTPSSNTGPSQDLSGNGYYIYIEASGKGRLGEKARIGLPNLSGAQCLSFGYNMYGAYIGKLNVYATNQLIYTKEGQQEKGWKKTSIEIPSRFGSYQIIFEGVVGRNYQGDIAIDEISVTPGKCGSGGTPPPNPTPSPPNPTPSPPNPTPNPPSGKCGVKGPGLSDDPRIVGGQEATPGEWPWQVALMRGSFPFCGGSLVSNEYIITAAHCVKASDWSRVKIRLGEHDMGRSEGHEQDITIARNGITVHPNYDSRRTNYDIAVIKLSRRVTHTNRIKPVCINRGTDFTGQRCYITGWGRLRSGGSTPKRLQEAQVPIVTRDECRKAYGQSRITDKMICAGYSQGGTDTCQGDSGGPMVCLHSDGSWHLTGITSWGSGCAKPRYYGVYAHVGGLYSWINRVTGL